MPKLLIQKQSNNQYTLANLSTDQLNILHAGIKILEQSLLIGSSLPAQENHLFEQISELKKVSQLN